MKNVYIVTLKNRDDINVVAESFSEAAGKVGLEHGESNLFRIELHEENIEEEQK